MRQNLGTGDKFLSSFGEKKQNTLINLKLRGCAVVAFFVLDEDDLSVLDESKNP